MAVRRSNRFRVRFHPKHPESVKIEDVFGNLSEKDRKFVEIVIKKIKLICKSKHVRALEDIELKTSDFTDCFVVPNIQYIFDRLCDLDLLTPNKAGNYILKKDSDLYKILEEMKL